MFRSDHQTQWPSTSGQRSSRSVSQRELRRALRRRVRLSHPDLFQDNPVRRQTAERQLRELIAAYETASRELSATQPSDPASSIGATVSIQPPESLSLPPRPLALGQLLCHLGWISARDLFSCLDTQRRHSPKIGQVAGELGLLTSAQVLAVLSNQKHDERFGQCAERIGVLCSEQVLRVVSVQQQRRTRLGALLLKQGLVTGQQLRDAIRRQQEHNRRVEQWDRARQ